VQGQAAAMAREGPGGGGWGRVRAEGTGPDGSPLTGGRGPAVAHAPVGAGAPTRPPDPIQRNPQESWYRSSNLGAPSRRLGDTGEIPVVGAAGSQGSAGGAARPSSSGAIWAPWALEADDGQPDASQGDDDRGSQAREIPLYPPAHWSEN
jgi:hypothetical protein